MGRGVGRERHGDEYAGARRVARRPDARGTRSCVPHRRPRRFCGGGGAEKRCFALPLAPHVAACAGACRVGGAALSRGQHPGQSSVSSRWMSVSHPAATDPVICLASMSPRRRELLAQIGVPHTIVAAHADESLLPAEQPADYVVRLARLKATTVRQHGETLPVLAADTTVVLEGSVFGKPVDRADGIAMLAALAGGTHQVLTAVALAKEREVAVRVNCSS